MHTAIQASGNCRDARTGPLIAFLTHSTPALQMAEENVASYFFFLAPPPTLLPATTTAEGIFQVHLWRGGRERGDRLVVRLRPRTPPSSRAVKVFTRRGSFP